MLSAESSAVADPFKPPKRMNSSGEPLRSTVDARVTVMTFVAEGKGVLWPMFARMKVGEYTRSGWASPATVPISAVAFTESPATGCAVMLNVPDAATDSEAAA